MRPDVLLDRAAKALESVEASSLTRVLMLVGKQIGQDVRIDSPFAIMTAYRSDLRSDANAKRLNQMESMLGRNGIRSYRLSGDWLEAPEGQQFDQAQQEGALIHITEDALYCIPEPDVAFEDFEIACIRQADRFDQDAIILGSGGPKRRKRPASVWIRFRDGHMKALPDTMQVSAVETAYKEMRNQREHPFSFT